MPKRPAISQAFLTLELKKRRDIFHEDGSLKGKTCKVWEDLRNSLSLTLQPQSLYLSVYKNKPLIAELKSHFGNNYIETEKIALESDPNYTPNCEIKNPYNGTKLEFDIKVPSCDIIECLASKKLKDGWTNKVRDEMWNIKELPCPFALNGYVTNKEFKFSGQCSECKTGIVGESDNQDDMLTIHIQTFETYHITHSQKVRLQGSRRGEIKQVLRHQTANKYREEQLQKITTKYEPPQLNTTITLRKVREEAIDEFIGYKEFKGLSVTNIKFLHQCGVRKLSMIPFQIIYFSDDQLQFWNEIQNKMLPLSFDSTGSLVKKYTFYKNIKSKTLFYYAIVVGIDGKIIPLLQAILSIHHVSVIQEILDRWLQFGAKIPKEMVTDGSLALQNAVCLSFNKMTFKQYNSKCFEVLICNQKINELPACYLRHDVAHLLKAVSEWKCLKKVTEVVRDFYLRAIGYLTQSDSMHKFVDVVTCIIIIANSPLSTEDSKCYSSILKLTNIFKTYRHQLHELSSVTASNNRLDSEQVYNNIKEASHNPNSISLFVDNLFSDLLCDCANNSIVSDKVNYYYCPEFIKLFKERCYTFPTWTNCMKPFFNSPNDVGTSTRSETNFKDLKSNIPYPLKIQKFILKDCKRNAAKVNVGFMKLKEERQMNSNSGSLFDLNLDNLMTSVLNQHQELRDNKVQQNLNSELERQNVSNSSIYNISSTNILTSSPILKNQN